MHIVVFTLEWLYLFYTHSSQLRDFLYLALNEALPTKTRVDWHNQHQINHCNSARTKKSVSNCFSKYIINHQSDVIVFLSTYPDHLPLCSTSSFRQTRGHNAGLQIWELLFLFLYSLRPSKAILDICLRYLYSNWTNTTEGMEP